MHSLNDVSTRLADAKPGEILLLTEGSYSGEACVLSGKGLEGKPIVLRADPVGSVRFTSPVLLRADYVRLEGVVFEDGGNLEVDGAYCRISRCVWSDAQPGKWIRVRPGSRRIEIDHCRFENKTNNRELPRGCQLMQIVVRNEGEAHHVHHNHFVDVPQGKTNNGYETLQLITEGNPFDPEPGDCGTVIEHNLFERCSGEAEIISVKSNGNTVRANTFRKSRGSLVLRTGDGNVVSRNVFLGDGESGAGGVRLQGEDQVVVNNLFRSIPKFGVAMMDGTPDDLYIRTQRALVAFNTFVGCHPAFEIGANHSKHPNGSPPKDCVIANNLIVTGPLVSTETRMVRFVKDDEPVDWVWDGNVTDGTIGVSERAGIRRVDLSLHYRDDGLVFPSDQAEVDASAASEEIAADLLGTPRGKARQVGCLESESLKVVAGPLRPGDVGPEAD